MTPAPLVSQVSINRSNPPGLRPAALRPTEKPWLSANVRARGGEERRKRLSGRLKRPEARRRPLLPDPPLHLEDSSSTLKMFVFLWHLPHAKPSQVLTHIHPNIQEKPQVLTAIANASSAANNLVNAITVRLLQFRG